MIVISSAVIGLLVLSISIQQENLMLSHSICFWVIHREENGLLNSSEVVKLALYCGFVISIHVTTFLDIVFVQDKCLWFLTYWYSCTVALKYVFHTMFSFSWHSSMEVFSLQKYLEVWEGISFFSVEVGCISTTFFSPSHSALYLKGF